MKYLIFFILLIGSQAVAMQSPVSADRDQCLADYKSNPLGIHDDEICMNLADMGMPEIQYLVGLSYLKNGNTNKAKYYFKEVVETGREYRKEAEKQLEDINE